MQMALYAESLMEEQRKYGKLFNMLGRKIVRKKVGHGKKRG